MDGLVKNSSLSVPVKKIVTLDSKVLGRNAFLKSNDGSYTVKLTGGKSNDSLRRRAGNDSLWNNAGKDTFIFTANKGTDKIFDYRPTICSKS